MQGCIGPAAACHKGYNITRLCIVIYLDSFVRLLFWFTPKPVMSKQVLVLVVIWWISQGVQSIGQAYSTDE